MKKVILGLLSVLWRIAIPFLSAVIGLKVVGRFNFFEFFNIIKDADRAFEICTTVYFTVADVILLYVTDIVKQQIFVPQIIQVILSKPKEMVHLESKPDLVLRSGKPKEAILTINIDAKKKNCKNIELIIDSVNFATMQLPKARTEARVDEKGDFVVNIEQLFGNQEQVKTTQTFKILFANEPVKGKCQSEVYPRLNKEPWCLTFKTNKMIIRTE